ncbi:uncharacterized protein MELLADRAFT_110660 [Melampsora larici-populina 98AG31]|uniref:F-box domain-containing protein n=1 Tax=Melampsora larici-populina (strain 98AG31 / pathotype 3-4-7) TaxID=747676 RepID=F4S0I9_MELLP|nr:uncharacterized protein MELLADRAFT_110660 [Melampsora larici-populina 98AG31]EGG01775.1 hypothetical protein MELLADRAFT_110660 [Melampsora larici-populina 98AG31]
MIGSLTGACDYLTSELHKHHPKLNKAVFDLIFWSIHEELRQDINIEGSAGEAFEFLANQFQSNPSVQCIMSRAGLPEEILENIVNMVYQQSSKEKNTIKARKLERRSHAPHECGRHKAHHELPILDTFQNLAVVNRKFHKLCLPKLWQHIRFPSALPAPMSIWTEGILLRHGHLVESCEFRLEDRSFNEDESAFERSIDDNKAICTHGEDDDEEDDEEEGVRRIGIGAINVEKIFKACPSLKSVEIKIPTELDELDFLNCLLGRLNGLFGLVPKLQHLILRDFQEETYPRPFVFNVLKKLPSLVSLELIGFKFNSSDPEYNLGWNLAQHQNLRKVHLYRVTCKSDDRTWGMQPWPQQLTTLDICFCEGLKAGMVQKLLSGCAPYLTKLKISLSDFNDDSEVEGQTKLPALEQLILGNHKRSFDLLVSCKGCQNIRLIKSHLPLTNNQWSLVKHLLSTCTWPKLSVLRLCNDDPRNKNQDMKKLTKTDVNEIWATFKIKLFIDPNPYGLWLLEQ